MSVSWLVGFRKKPKLKDLDEFMQLLEFTIEEPGKRRGKYARVYNHRKYVAVKSYILLKEQSVSKILFFLLTKKVLLEKKIAWQK